MGKDKGHLPPHLSGPFFSRRELEDVLVFLRKHEAKAVVYGGGGELFTWPGAYDFVKTINDFGLRAVIFTNGSLLTRERIAWLNSMGVVLIVSLRDTVEAHHNAAVGGPHFQDTLACLEAALEEGFQYDQRLAVEIPVTRNNELRVLNDFLPVMRALGIFPMAEEYIQISTSPSERRECHTFSQSRAFFQQASKQDSQLGLSWIPEHGQRIVGQPQCKRPLYSFALFPNGDVMDCPSHSVCYGNFRESSLDHILLSEAFRKQLLGFQLCACSVFYTDAKCQVPNNLPDYLEVLR